jgi:hypothetical protein
VPLNGHTALATWVDESAATWAQFIDTSARAPLGPASSLGQLAGGDAGAEPDVFPLSDGDVAFAGVLADGRITLARGSEVAARRLAPRVVWASEEPPVRGLAVARRGDGLTLLVLRGPRAAEAREPMQVQLQPLDPHGAPLGPPRQWSSPAGYWPRMAECEGTLFLAWTSPREVLVTRVASGDAANTTTALPALPRSQARLAPLACTPGGVRLLAAWRTTSEHADAASKLSFATLTRDNPEPRATWTSVRLPGAVQQWGDDAAFIDPSRDLARATIQRGDLTQSVTVDLATARVASTPEPVPLPSLVSCVPGAGDQLFCATTARQVVRQECHEVESTLVYTFPGPPAAASVTTPLPAARQYFAAPQPIADAARPPASVLAERASRSYCGEPGWDALRDALGAWCRDPSGARAHFDAASEDELGDFDIYCGPQPHSALYQATHCTDQPVTCKPDPDRRLNVDRQQLHSGSKELWLPIENCNISFAGKPGAWHVTGAACESAE